MGLSLAPSFSPDLDGNEKFAGVNVLRGRPWDCLIHAELLFKKVAGEEKVIALQHTSCVS